MLNIEGKRIVHNASQRYIGDESNSLINHLDRIGADPLTKRFCESLILSLKDKSDLATILFEENEKLIEMLREMQK